jgi:hypothetical protein
VAQGDHADASCIPFESGTTDIKTLIDESTFGLIDEEFHQSHQMSGA